MSLFILDVGTAWVGCSKQDTTKHVAGRRVDDDQL